MEKHRTKIMEQRPERLRMTIDQIERSYHLYKTRPDTSGWSVDDEICLDIEGAITHVARRHRRHIGCRFSLGLMAARHFDEFGALRERPYLLPMRLRGEDRGAAAYIPSDSFWNLSVMLGRGLFRFIELSFEPLRYGSGALEGVLFTSTEEEWVE